MYLYLQKSSIRIELFAPFEFDSHSKLSTSAHSFPFVAASRCGLKAVLPTELNHVVPLHTTLSIFSSHGVSFSTVDILARASSMVPMKGRGHDQKLK